MFLDLSGQVSGGNEQGLLGLAFDPQFATNGQFYVNYTDADGDTQIVRFMATGDVADPASGEVLLSVDQPQGNHNGGWLGFGPDGMLYIGMGDGGGGGDRHGEIGNGQDTNALLGKILRIDPRGEPYAIPPDNPYANGGGAPEVFAYGVRNPWRNAFDGNLLYVADVGQNAWEEISVIDVTADAGANLGLAHDGGARVLSGRDDVRAGRHGHAGARIWPRRRVLDHRRDRLSRGGAAGTAGTVFLRGLLQRRDRGAAL